MTTNQTLRVGIHQVTPTQDRDCESLSIKVCVCGHHIALMHWLWGCDGLTESGEPCSCRGRGYVEGKGIYSTAHVEAVLSRWARDGVPS